ncbi:Hpt domain-containing protein [Chitinibacter sp. S2-10]|uniref:Hpt domain-containing protein n=1 Tax=Chitinibacter sp. S2-10 TaxID=3373597 RepID=UPI00397787EB
MGSDGGNILRQELADIEAMLFEINTAVGIDMRADLLESYFPTQDECLLGLKEAILVVDEVQIAGFSHKLKGAAAQLGARKISSICKDIELKARKNQLDGIAKLLSELEQLCTSVKAGLV